MKTDHDLAFKSGDRRIETRTALRMKQRMGLGFHCVSSVHGSIDNCDIRVAKLGPWLRGVHSPQTIRTTNLFRLASQNKNFLI